jgi:hypothetical protein
VIKQSVLMGCLLLSFQLSADETDFSCQTAIAERLTDKSSDYAAIGRLRQGVANDFRILMFPEERRALGTRALDSDDFYRSPRTNHQQMYPEQYPDLDKVTIYSEPGEE